MSAINDLVVRLSATTGKFDKNMNRSVGRVRRLSGAVGGLSRRLVTFGVTALGVGSMAGLGFTIKKTLDMMDSAGKLSDRIGIATERLQGLRHAAELTGAGADTLDAGLTTMAKRLGEAARGAGAATPALKQLGLSIENLLAMSPDQQFIAIGEALQRLPTVTQRAAAAANIFSKGNMALINTLALTREEFEANQREVERLGTAFTRDMARGAEDANDALTRLGATMSGVMIKAASDLASTIDLLAEQLSVALPEAIEGSATAFIQLEKFMTSGSIQFARLGRKFFTAIEWATGSTSDSVQVLTFFIEEQQKQLAKMDDALAGKTGKGKRAGSDTGGPGQLDAGAIADSLDAAEETARRVGSIYDATRTPMERYEQKVADLMSLWDSGAFEGNWNVVQRQLDAYEAALESATKNPAMDAFDDMAERVFRLTNHLSDAQIALREFSQQPGVTPWQIHEFEQMTKELERLQKVDELKAKEKMLMDQMGAVPAETRSTTGPDFSGAVDKGSAEAWSRILAAGSASRKGPEEKTAKNTEKMARELAEVRLTLSRMENSEQDLREIRT